MIEIKLPKNKYAIIYADPPWSYREKVFYGTKINSSADMHYPTMSLKELERVPVLDITEPDALLFLWGTGPNLDQALDLGRSWGFKYITVGFVWDKQRHNPGHYTMSYCEFCLIFKRGRIPKPRGARNIKQLVSTKRERHSRKPEEIRTAIEEMFPTQNKVELFARETFPGWDAWGNEIN